MTLHDALAEARARLVAADFSHVEASIDVDLYARTILGWDRARLLTDLQDAPPGRLEPTLSEWITRRTRHEPTAYIVGTREFWGLDFAITPAVLVPRPETEFIVEETLLLLRTPGTNGLERSAALGTAPGDVSHATVRIADIGTGSGCVAIAVAVNTPTSRIVASDVSEAALVVARANAARHGVADRLDFVATSYLDGVDGLFQIITANPPYVKDGDKPAISRVTRHEPEVALYGGAEGLRDITGVLDTAAAKLEPGGWLVMEFGYGQEEGVETLLAARPALRMDHVRSDLQGIPRTAVIQRR
ncbi:MAG: peptide chain release factor N(5)-glutamine methyltransferase [Acidobacteria bacterium]|nr:peptide chain release factor N(5)-glutamine methyltransferase [Acidobacteriota bacterium]